MEQEKPKQFYFILLSYFCFAIVSRAAGGCRWPTNQPAGGGTRPGRQAGRRVPGPVRSALSSVMPPYNSATGLADRVIAPLGTIGTWLFASIHGSAIHTVGYIWYVYAHLSPPSPFGNLKPSPTEGDSRGELQEQYLAVGDDRGHGSNVYTGQAVDSRPPLPGIVSPLVVRADCRLRHAV